MKKNEKWLSILTAMFIGISSFSAPVQADSVIAGVAVTSSVATVSNGFKIENGHGVFYEKGALVKNKWKTAMVLVIILELMEVPVQVVIR